MPKVIKSQENRTQLGNCKIWVCVCVCVMEGVCVWEYALIKLRFFFVIVFVVHLISSRKFSNQISISYLPCKIASEIIFSKTFATRKIYDMKFNMVWQLFEKLVREFFHVLRP